MYWSLPPASMLLDCRTLATHAGRRISPKPSRAPCRCRPACHIPVPHIAAVVLLPLRPYLVLRCRCLSSPPAIMSSQRRGHWRSVWDRTARLLGFRPGSRSAEQTDEAPTHPPPGSPGNAVPRLEHHPAPMPAPEFQPYAFVQETVREFITSHRHLVDNMVEVVDNMVEVVRLTSQRNCDHTQLGDSTGSRPASGPGTLGSSQAVLPGDSGSPSPSALPSKVCGSLPQRDPASNTRLCTLPFATPDRLSLSQSTQRHVQDPARGVRAR